MVDDALTHAPPVLDARAPVDLTGRTALVTGAASGIGAAIAVAFAAAGAKVHAVDRDGAGLSALATDDGVTAVVADLTDLDALAQLPTDVDILVNNAGIQHVSPVEEFPLERFDTIIDLMLAAPFRLIRQSLPHMYAKGWGRVINISSVHGLRASAYKAAYVAAKHGLEGLSKVVALEGAPHGVTSTCINPAYVRTPLVEKQVADQARTHGIAETEVLEQVMLAPVAVKRLVEPEEVAALALFLCGPASSSVTGTSFSLDGGWTAH
jgi:3-hydroxybutyrate dehydrogenase